MKFLSDEFHKTQFWELTKNPHNSGNALAPWSSNPLPVPVLNQICVATWHHQGTTRRRKSFKFIKRMEPKFPYIFLAGITFQLFVCASLVGCSQDFRHWWNRQKRICTNSAHEQRFPIYFRHKPTDLGLYWLSGWTSYHQISWKIGKV